MTATECVLVVDFGGQYTHLISRRCRELGVFAKIIPQDKALTGEDLQGVKGMILSGGPRSIEDSDLGAPFDANMEQLHENQIPALGICFGHQLLAVWKGARLSPGGNPEYGKTELQLLKKESILADLENGQQVWMSHSDEVAELSQDLEPLAMSGEARIAAFRSKDGFFFGVQFHPEVTHTPNGITILQRFLRNKCQYKDTWSPEEEVSSIVNSIRKKVGDGRVLMGTSGGVDSTVAAYLIHQAIGDRLYCVFVDNGLLRAGERHEVVRAFREMDFEHFVVADASERFLTELEGVEDPEEKRKVIADTFIEVFEEKAKNLGDEIGEFDFLGQGTIYPDRVESAATGKSTAVIKSHHNVRLPAWMSLKLVEPLKNLYKDEVRKVGISLGIPNHMVRRQPFPGPSLAIRIGGPVTEKQITIVREADAILQNELKNEPIYSSIWQSFCVLLPVRSVGVMGDERTYDQAIAIRIVESSDAMTASVIRPDWSLLLHISSRIVNEVDGINRVVYDLTSKPPGTIEWY